MKKLNDCWTYLSDTKKGRISPDDIAANASSPTALNFRQLRERIAEISYFNPEYTLFFRGQHKDHRNANGSTTLLPSIFRTVRAKPLDKKSRERRLSDLERAETLLLEMLRAIYKKAGAPSTTRSSLAGFSKMKIFRELQWGILQHYEVCATPLLDVTLSLYTAAWFALNENHDDHGYLYVLAIPHLNGSISYYVEERMLAVKLSSICTPKALRPHFQDAILLGNFPTRYDADRRPYFKVSTNYDFSRRLVAKFRLSNTRFWDKSSSEPKKRGLLPTDDEILRICDSIKVNLSGTVGDLFRE